MRAAHNLVQAARGNFTGDVWRAQQCELASSDDITCFVIPLKRAAQTMSYTFRNEKSSSPLDELTTSQHSDASADNAKKSEDLETSERKQERLGSDSVSESALDDLVTDGRATEGETLACDGEEPQCTESKE